MQAPPDLGSWSSVDGAAVHSVSTSATTIHTKNAGRGCGVAMLIVFLVIAGSIAIPVYLAVKGGKLSSVFADKPDGRAVVAPPSLNGGKTVFTLTSRPGSGSTRYTMVRLDEGNTSPVWTSAEFNSPGITSAPIVTDGARVYVPDGERIVALKVGDGTVAWQAPLTDEFQTSCDKCLFFAGDRLVVGSKDATFHAFATATGEKAWTHRAKDSTATAAAFGDKTLVLDRDVGFKGLVLLLNADGTEASRLQPVCRKPDSGIDEVLESDASVILRPDENAAIFGWGSPYPCWSRIDFGTGQQSWTTVLENTSYPVDNHETSIVTQGTKAAIVGDKFIAALNLETGEYTPINEIEDTKMYPIALRENTLILQTASQRGTTKYAINAVDMTSGTGVWNIDLGKARPSDGPDANDIFVSSDGAQFTSSLDGDTFRTLVFDSPTRQLTTYTVTVSNGTQTKTAVPSGVDESLPYFDVLTWRGPTAVISFRRGGLVVLDTGTGSITYRYP